MQHCLCPLANTLAELHFQHNMPSDSKENENKVYTMVKYGETFYKLRFIQRSLDNNTVTLFFFFFFFGGGGWGGEEGG